ncbi:MAG: Divergent polysaccharide deacetylase [Alphaproteobacteria bacterium ADurb.Bin438]|nr:MAG: Divergent polysaccharide deacetylase [Alphaproteobacteria bacterium ADurb.Bin438]
MKKIKINNRSKFLKKTASNIVIKKLKKDRKVLFKQNDADNKILELNNPSYLKVIAIALLVIIVLLFIFKTSQKDEMVYNKPAKFIDFTNKFYEEKPVVKDEVIEEEIEIIRTKITEKDLHYNTYNNDKLLFEDFEDTEPVVEKDIPPEPKKIIVDKKSMDKDALWRKYQVKVNKKRLKNKPVIAIIIDDVGLNKEKALKLINLKGHLTMSFLPYGNNLDDLSKLARKKGHEVMLHAPMEPKGKHNPGPNALYTSMSDEEIRQTAFKMFDAFKGFVGVNNHMGSKFTTDERSMRVFLKALKEKGLLFVDSKTLQKSYGDKVADELGIPNASRDVFIDHIIDEEKALKQLKHLENKALKYGYTVGIGHPHKVTISALEKWIPTLKEKGIELVPISYVVEHNYMELVSKNKDNNRISLKSNEKNGKN